MSERIRSWSKVNSRELEDTLALNFCWNVDTHRLVTSDVLKESSILLRDQGYSSTSYGVGNFGFRFTNHFNPITTDGKIEGHHNDPQNDYDIVTVTNAGFSVFRDSTNRAIEIVRKRYGTPNTEEYFHWATLSEPKWKGSAFNMPEYCAVNYNRLESAENTQMEIHYLESEAGWHKELLSKYAPWHSSKFGFPIVSISNNPDSSLRTGIWQPFARDVNRRKKHEVKISVPEMFGDNPRDVFQATRIVFGTIQATVNAKIFATLSSETKAILKDGVKKASKGINSIQQEKAIKRLKTLIHRAESLEGEMEHFCYIEDCKNPFSGRSSVKEIIINNLDEVDWGVNVLGQPLKQVVI